MEDWEEDVNSNGERDPGETSPALADSDGDGMDDEGEVLSGTDPCDGAAYFRLMRSRRRRRRAGSRYAGSGARTGVTGCTASSASCRERRQRR